MSIYASGKTGKDKTRLPQGLGEKVSATSKVAVRLDENKKRANILPLSPTSIEAPRNLDSDALEPGGYVEQVLAHMPFTVSVVIPTLNEAQNLRAVLPRIPAFVSEIVVVDGFSTDETLDVVAELVPEARIIKQSRRGKGNAMAHGFAEATGDIIIMLDADGSADPGEIARFVIALLQGADFVKGSRYACGGGSSDLSRLRSAGNRGLTQLVNVAYRSTFTDLCYGYNAFWRRHVPALGTGEIVADVSAQERVWGDGFEIETLIMVRAVLAGLRIVEVPSFEHSRVNGESHLNTFRDGYRVLRTAIRERMFA